MQVRAPDLYPERPNWLVRRYAARMRSYPRGLDTALIASELRISERTVIMIQLKLGLRRCRTHEDYAHE